MCNNSIWIGLNIYDIIYKSIILCQYSIDKGVFEMEYIIGCNYWGSKYGTEMWANWDSESVENDLRTLKQFGVNTLRVFPLWRDFQPIVKETQGKGAFKEYRFVNNINISKNNEFYLDGKCIEHFSEFCNIADKYQIKFVVSIVTGWMSGKIYAPQALNNKNLITDPEALMLQEKFVRGFVRLFKNRSCILSWDIGNECNCMGACTKREEAYLWTCTIRNAIKAEDSTRIVSSGMHALTPQLTDDNPWKIQDQGFVCDEMSVHAYPSPTVGGDIDPATGLRTSLIATAQLEFYSHIGGKPAMLQEIGPMVTEIHDEKAVADIMRVNLRSTWANGSRGLLWWCAHEQSGLDFPPYTWVMLERELGLLHIDLSPKLCALEMQKFARIINELPLDNLPKKQIDAVVIIPLCNDKWWQICATSYILAKEAGYNVVFVTEDKELPKADLYIVPNLVGWTTLGKERYMEIMQKAKEGATVYFSADSGLLTDFEKFFGLHSIGYRKSKKPRKITVDTEEFEIRGECQFLAQPLTSEVLSKDDEGNVIFSRNKYGKGFVYFLGAPFEANVWNSEDMSNPTKPAYYKLYKMLGEEILKKKPMISNDPEVMLTIHPEGENSAIAIGINYSSKNKNCEFILQNGWKIKEKIYGDQNNLINGEMVIFRIQK